MDGWSEEEEESEAPQLGHTTHAPPKGLFGATQKGAGGKEAEFNFIQQARDVRGTSNVNSRRWLGMGSVEPRADRSHGKLGALGGCE